MLKIQDDYTLSYYLCLWLYRQIENDISVESVLTDLGKEFLKIKAPIDQDLLRN